MLRKKKLLRFCDRHEHQRTLTTVPISSLEILLGMPLSARCISHYGAKLGRQQATPLEDQHVLPFNENRPLVTSIFVYLCGVPRAVFVLDIIYTKHTYDQHQQIGCRRDHLTIQILRETGYISEDDDRVVDTLDFLHAWVPSIDLFISQQHGNIACQFLDSFRFSSSDSTLQRLSSESQSS